MMHSSWCLVISFTLINVVNAHDTFTESLNIDVIGNDQVHAFFNFSTNWNYDRKSIPHHYRLFPRSLGQLILKYNIDELHFTMTQGLWRYKLWGFPRASSPTGAQIWVWFKKDTSNVEKNWIGFTNALSGLFCASLNLINKAVTVSPIASFRPSGVVENGLVDNHFLRYGTLARENLCTENLTPWLKLLPCGSKSGAASLLNPSQLHHSRFLSIGLHFKHDCFENNCVNPFVQLQQHVSVVYDIHSTIGESGFSLVSLFDRKLKPACPVATSSLVKILAPSQAIISPNLDSIGNGYLQLNLSKISKDVDIRVKFGSLLQPFILSTGMSSNCYLTGVGLEGGLRCSMTNYVNHNITVIFFQVIPWFLHAQLHTLKITSHGRDLSPAWLSFTPAKIRESPYTLETMITLPALSVVDLSIEFTRGFLTWTEHPPDANHGFYISPAVITVQTVELDLPEDYDEPVQHIYCESLLVNIPVPDFSMPYNVICLACTVLAIAYGSLHNIITRRFHKLSPSRVHPLKQKLRQFLPYFSSKKHISEKDKDTSCNVYEDKT